MKTRRDFLQTMGLAAAAGSFSSARAASSSGSETGGQAVSPSSLSVTLTFPDGSVKNFSGASGKDLGDHVVPFARIVQRNVVVKDPTNQYSVYFRPDRNNERVEVVVLYGDPFQGPAVTGGSYVCEIFSNGRSLAKIDVPYHFWLARWRWTSAARPRIRKPADLVAAKLCVPYASTSMSVRLPGAAPAYTVMGHSSVTNWMDQTGERGDIGINPENTSAYMATESEGCYQSMMEWAEASGSGPWHLNDPKTGGILNWDNWPTASVYDVNRSTPKIYVTRSDPPHKDTFIHPGAAHHPMLSYVPFLLTGDPYHAEELQYTISYYLGAEHNSSGLKSYIFDTIQTRGFAWTLRSALFAYLVSDQIQSPTLLPTAFWKKVLDLNAAWITKNFVNGTDANARVFSSGTSKTGIGFWQEDYLCSVLGMMQRLERFPQWKPVFDWKIKSNINRLNGTSGWPRTHPTLYYAQWFEQVFAARPTNKGNGSITQGRYSVRVNPIGKFGNWTITFIDDQTFRLTMPDGRDASGATGTVNKPLTNGYGPSFTIRAGEVPFQAGDSFTLTIQPVTTWADLARVNGIADSGEDDLQGANGEYMSHLYAAMALAAPIDPEARPLFNWLSNKMQSFGGHVSWRDSFASS